MRKITCDRCGAVISTEENDNAGYVSLQWRSLANAYDLGGVNQFEEWDFCPDCMKAIEEFVKKQPKEEKFARILDSVDAGKKPKPKKAVKEWDKGKAQALRNAGWKLADIAKEVGVAVSAVSKHTHPAQPKIDRPNEWAEKEPDLSVSTRTMMGETHLEEVEV